MARFAGGAFIALSLFLLPCLFLEHHLDGLVENLFKSLLGQCTALDIFAFHLFLDNFLGSFPSNWCLFGVTALLLELLPQVDFVANENFRGGRHAVLEFWEPLNKDKGTFFLALRKEGGSMTEKQMMKTSQWGYARGRSRLYYSWPAVSLCNLTRTRGPN